MNRHRPRRTKQLQRTCPRPSLAGGLGRWRECVAPSVFVALLLGCGLPGGHTSDAAFPDSPVALRRLERTAVFANPEQLFVWRWDFVDGELLSVSAPTRTRPYPQRELEQSVVRIRVRAAVTADPRFVYTSEIDVTLHSRSWIVAPDGSLSLEWDQSFTGGYSTPVLTVGGRYVFAIANTNSLGGAFAVAGPESAIAEPVFGLPAGSALATIFDVLTAARDRVDARGVDGGRD